jgi:hypothetical protein
MAEVGAIEVRPVAGVPGVDTTPAPSAAAVE